MPRPFKLEEEKTMRRIVVLRELIAGVELCDAPCPLLRSELNTTQVLLEQLRTEVLKLAASLDREARRHE